MRQIIYCISRDQPHPGFASWFVPGSRAHSPARPGALRAMEVSTRPTHHMQASPIQMAHFTTFSPLYAHTQICPRIRRRRRRFVRWGGGTPGPLDPPYLVKGARGVGGWSGGCLQRMLLAVRLAADRCLIEIESELWCALCAPGDGWMGGFFAAQ